MNVKHKEKFQEQVEVLKNVVNRLVEEGKNNAIKESGKIYIEFLQKVLYVEYPDLFKNAPAVSIFMKDLKQMGYIKVVAPATRDTRAIFDFTDLMNTDFSTVFDDEKGLSDEVKSERKVSVSLDTEKEMENKEIIRDLKLEISQMKDFLSSLPNEMNQALKNLSNKLDLADEEEVLELTKENQNLKEKVGYLTEEVNKYKKKNFSQDQIVRKVNFIQDELERLVHLRAWNQNNNKLHHKKQIEKKLSEILNELDIKM